MLRKAVCNQAGDMKKDLQHVLHWKELPSGEEISVESYDGLMCAAGALANTLEEALAGIRGMLTARSARAKKS